MSRSSREGSKGKKNMVRKINGRDDRERGGYGERMQRRLELEQKYCQYKLKKKKKKLKTRQEVRRE